MDKVHPAVERVALQLQSPLAKQLVALCAEFYAWVDETRKDRIVGGKVPPATPGRIDEVNAYAKKVFAPTLMKICAQQLNLTAMVYINPSIDYGNAAMYPLYADIVAHEDFDELFLGRDLFSGTASHSTAEFNVEPFAKLADNLDLDKSKLIKKTKKYAMLCWINATNFMGPELFSGPEFYTAEEQAAAIMHEIGHAITVLEHMADLYHRADVATNSVKYLNTLADDKTTLQAANKLALVVPKDEPEYTTALDAAKANISNCHPVVAVIAFLYFAGVALAFIARFFAAGYVGKINAGSDKTSDAVVTQSNLSYVERIADEFVSRHGLGMALTTGLLKSGGYVRTPFGEAMHNTLIAKSVVFSVKIIVHFFGMFFYYDDGTYDPLWLRMEHLLANNMVIFKDEKLSPALRIHFLAETKALLDLIATYKKTPSVQFKQLFWGTIMRIVSRNSVLDAFRTANLSNDYDKLQLMTNGLIKNRLSYHAARLKNL